MSVCACMSVRLFLNSAVTPLSWISHLSPFSLLPSPLSLYHPPLYLSISIHPPTHPSTLNLQAIITMPTPPIMASLVAVGIVGDPSVGATDEVALGDVLRVDALAVLAELGYDFVVVVS